MGHPFVDLSRKKKWFFFALNFTEHIRQFCLEMCTILFCVWNRFKRTLTLKGGEFQLPILVILQCYLSDECCRLFCCAKKKKNCCQYVPIWVLLPFNGQVHRFPTSLGVTTTVVFYTRRAFITFACLCFAKNVFKRDWHKEDYIYDFIVSWTHDLLHVRQVW